MKSYIYKLEYIPDLSLSKYSSLSESGVDGVLLRNEAFLRQWQRICLIENVSIHFIAYYNPEIRTGARLNIYLEILASDEETKIKCEKLLFSSSLSEYFSFVACENNEVDELKALKFQYRACLTKKERVFESTVYMDSRTNTPARFYTVPEWKMNDKARLYDMFKTMQALNEASIYKVDLYAIDAYDSIFEIFKSPINKLREIRDKRNDRISISVDRSKNSFDKQRDVAAEETLKQYENFLDDVGTCPYFKANISVYMDDTRSANILLDSAASEALDEGDSYINVIECDDTPIPSREHAENWRKIISDKFSFWPTLFSIEDIKPFFCFPVLYDGEYLELRKETEVGFISDGKSGTEDKNEDKKENEKEKESENEKKLTFNAELFLGRDDNNREIYFPIENLNKHFFISGTPGSGKTNTMLLLCHTLWMKNRIPFLALEPAKKEYRALSLTDIDDLIVFSPSSGSDFPLALNPFEFVKGISLSEHIQNLMQVFEGTFPLDPPLPSLLDRSIENIYKDLGWTTDDINDGTKPYPTLSQLYKQLEYELKNTDYSGEVMGNMKSALEMRIGGLLKRDLGNIFDVNYSSLLPEEWIERPIIIEMESLGESPSNFITLMLCTIIRETLKVNPNDKKEMLTRHVLFIEEAHNLIGPTTYNPNQSNPDPKITATAYIVKMLAEVRALRESIIIADQLPTAMAPEVIKNTGTKIAHRITSLDDRNLIGQTMSATPLQLEQMATFSKGKTLVAYEGLLKPFKMQIELAPKKESPVPNDKELFNKEIEFNSFRKCVLRYYFSYFEKKKTNFIALSEVIYAQYNDLKKLSQLIKNCDLTDKKIVSQLVKKIELIKEDFERKHIIRELSILKTQTQRVIDCDFFREFIDSDDRVKKLSDLYTKLYHEIDIQIDKYTNNALNTLNVYYDKITNLIK